MTKNNFLLPVEEYQRAVNPIGDWLKQTSLYASKMTGKPYDACHAHLLSKLRSGVIPFNNPTVVHFERGENGDREQTSSKLTAYLKSVTDNHEILAPTFTTYLHPSVKESMIVGYLDINVAERKKYKKISQQSEAEGNIPRYKYYHNAQDAAKRRNNSVSGGFVAEGSVIKNKSAHSTLTSTTRSISSLSNASNERLIEGNRHYYTAQICLNNLISICAETNSQRISNVVSAFGLVYPSVEQTMECIRRSTDLYWRDRKALKMIQNFVEALTPAERASVVYTGDFYHIRKFNDLFARAFIAKLSRRGSTTPVENPVSVIHQTDEQIVNYAHHICVSLVEGIGKDYDQLSLENRYVVANTCLNIIETLEQYKDFIQAFFLTKNSPPTIATIPSMIRRTVVLSDTDSTMFAVDNWVDWYFGYLNFDDECYAVGGAIMFIATQSIAHILALFSANMNVARARLFTLAMKPEYVFPVFAQTSVAKHYYTATKIKEGNVYKGVKLEIKGVHMKDSSVPSQIIQGAAVVMENVINSVMKGNKLSLRDHLKQASDVEREILRSVFANEITYLKRTKIKEKSAYKQDNTGNPEERDKTPYQFYTMWESCFAATYGPAPKPPYNAVRIPLDLQNKSAVKAWLMSLPNQEFAASFIRWMEINNKVLISSLPIPMDHCITHGIPAELRVILDKRKIVLTLTKSYRNVLESLGYFSKRDMMISEQGY